MCDFNGTDKGFDTTISKWLAHKIDCIDELHCEGLIHYAQKHSRLTYDAVQFLFPLRVMQWAKKQAKKAALANHINQMFALDAMNGPNGDKLMERALYHFEAAKRIAIGRRTLALEDYYGYDVKGIDDEPQRDVRCKVPSGIDHVYTATSFGPKHMPAVVRRLRAGYIVVPKHLSETTDVEYLVPFVDSDSRKLWLLVCTASSSKRSQTGPRSTSHYRKPPRTSRLMAPSFSTLRTLRPISWRPQRKHSVKAFTWWRTTSSASRAVWGYCACIAGHLEGF